jgi:hypothetical protein
MGSKPNPLKIQENIKVVEEIEDEPKKKEVEEEEAKDEEVEEERTVEEEGEEAKFPATQKQKDIPNLKYLTGRKGKDTASRNTVKEANIGRKGKGVQGVGREAESNNPKNVVRGTSTKTKKLASSPNKKQTKKEKETVEEVCEEEGEKVAIESLYLAEKKTYTELAKVAAGEGGNGN